MTSQTNMIPKVALLQPPGRARKKPTYLRRFGAHIIVSGLGLLMLYPLIWMLSSSLKPTEAIFSEPGLIPENFTLDNYVQGWNALGLDFGIFVANSAVIAVLSVVGNLVSCSLAAYAFARLEFRYKKVMFGAMLATLMLPFHVVLVPQYILFHSAGMTDTFFPLIIPKFLAVDAFFIFLMVQFIRGLPKELDDAATVDGCSAAGVFWRIILPLMRPALAVTAVFTFIWTWNDFLTPLLYLTDQELFTVPLALNAFLDSGGASAWGPLFAMSILSVLPILVIFIISQKHLTEGIATSGLK
ncbi:carbohydrate ABC transporter permease [Arthrobacter sp. CDRTa11]|uniref:carbohydrate ABC transporter permease n=1 Tax=Arthrobacter sp. CDRTa11 TaxID=2651199 RepID=UPI002265D968|nr:carbohydrate ABC transporter permease [Arthrobacter sp. CDRTa11]UZX02948.1 carbohydrate ABC transporter permease [Arthrobacter sp. CDRTa11]